MNKKDVFIAGVFAVLTIIFLLVSMGVLDFKRGQGFVATLAFVSAIISAAYVYVKAQDKTIKWIWIVVVLILGIIPFASFISH